MKKINWAKLPESIVVNFDGKTFNVSRENTDLYNKVYSAIQGNNLDYIPGILDIIGPVRASVQGNKSIEVRGNYVYIDGESVVNSITNRIIQYHNEGLPYDGLVEFWRNLKQNPSQRARDRLFLFLENGGHPFTDDGHFIAYKAVNKGMKDIRTGQFDNSIGATPKMDRSQISDDPEVTCASGLHVASFAYLTDSGYYNMSGENGYIYICVKVNPMNVVSIPIDYENKKMRVCEYTVISLSESPLKETHYFTPKPAAEPVAVDSSSSSSSSEDSTSDLDENKDSEADNKPPAFVSSEDLPAATEIAGAPAESSDSEESSSSSEEG